MFLADDENAQTGRRWRFPGKIKDVKYTDLVVSVENGPAVRIDPKATDLKATALTRGFLAQ
jgi:hypothetical protein